MPGVEKETVRVAMPLAFSGAVPRTVAPSRKVMVPVGVPEVEVRRGEDGVGVHVDGVHGAREAESRAEGLDDLIQHGRVAAWKKPAPG